MATPTAARRHHRRFLAIQLAILVGLRRAWRRMEPLGRWEEQYRDEVGPQLLLLLAAAQTAAVRDADTYIAELLNELDLVPGAAPGVVRPAGFVGLAGDGRPVETLLELAVPRAGQALNAAMTPEAVLTPSIGEAAQEALDETEKWLEMVAQTLIADATRAAESAILTTYPEVEGYVRMLNPPSCSRCVILAGRFYRWNDGFQRHPRCDCIHIPAAEADSGDIRVNPSLYFDSLTPAAQDKTFTKAGAQAIRDGADISQVVNSRRGMNTAQQNLRGWIARGRAVRNEFGVFTTTEGTTRRGAANRARTGRNATWRLMPESIYELAAGDRAEAIRLLRLHGFIL